jgi:hypothetical protein
LNDSNLLDDRVYQNFSLPSYDSYEDLRQMFLIAINEGYEGFGELDKLSNDYLPLFVDNVLTFSSGLYSPPPGFA